MLAFVNPVGASSAYNGERLIRAAVSESARDRGGVRSQNLIIPSNQELSLEASDVKRRLTQRAERGQHVQLTWDQCR